MPSSIFGGNPAPGGNQMQGLLQLMGMLKGKDPQAVMHSMMQSNPQFAQFMQQANGKTPEEVAKAYGIDINMLRNLIK